MKFENDFTVQAPIDEVWTTLLDVERVAPCMPGAEVLERTGDNAYKVGIRVKVGPISMLYRGQVEITERDDAAHRAMMRAKAREARGQGTADAHVEMTLTEESGGTHAQLETNLQLSGRAAAMGRGVIGDVAEKLIETFAGNLAGMLAGPAPEAEPAPAPAVGAAAASAEGDGAGETGAESPAAVEAPAARETPAPVGAPSGAATSAGAPSGATTSVGAPGGAATPPGAEAGPRPGAPGATPPPPPPPPADTGADGGAAGDSLPIGEIAAGVIAGRLRNPRNLLIAAGAVGLTFGVIGYALGRSR
jgi:carbon monoxide dehydrogenase subunit G